MIKFEICKYIDKIQGEYPNGLSEKDITDKLKYHDTPNFEWLESFDNEHEAREYFEETYRGMASTVRKQGWRGQYLYVEYYTLNEMEYDDDDSGCCCAQGNTISVIYAPLKPEED